MRHDVEAVEHVDGLAGFLRDYFEVRLLMSEQMNWSAPLRFLSNQWEKHNKVLTLRSCPTHNRRL
jgi:hypothetical protein